jgi:hypothetical protein
MKTVVAGSLGECVHVAGVMNFLRLAEAAGWRTVFLGPAVPIESVVSAAEREKADLVGVSYRLTAQNGERLLGEFAEAADDLRTRGVRFAFGGTPPVASRASSIGFFERVFDGSDSDEAVLAYLKGQPAGELAEEDIPQSAVARIRWKAPYPLLRHHFGLPTMEDTLAGVAQIARARVLDLISLGTDQDAQANFLHPERQDPRRRGAGGVPVRAPEDYRALFEASRRGNYPLMRTYSGTDDFLELAEMYVDTIGNAWCAIPIFWFNQMDGRGPWDLVGSIREHQKVMAWYGQRGIPVEVNEPHHWALRDAPDVLFVVAAYLSAYNARSLGVRDYVAQMMFNTPPAVSDAMDLAKMLASLEIVEPLCGPGFRLWRQTRTGLASYPQNMAEARAHLAASVYVQMALSPHVVHVVSHSEAHHAATADDVVEACHLARRAIGNALRGAPDMTLDARVQARKHGLLAEAEATLAAIRDLAPAQVRDPLVDPLTLASAVTSGILDAPHLRGNAYAHGRIVTTIDRRGACVAVDPETRQPLAESERLARLRV